MPWGWWKQVYGGMWLSGLVGVQNLFEEFMDLVFGRALEWVGINLYSTYILM